MNTEKTEKQRLQEAMVWQLASWSMGITFLVLGFAFLFAEPATGVLLLLAALVLIPPVVSWTEKIVRRRITTKERVLVFAICLCLAIAAPTLSGAATQSNADPASADTVAPTAPQEEMNLQVNLTTEAEATGDLDGGYEPVIAIKNLNSFEWDDCTVSLNNNEYTASLDFIATPAEFKERVASGTVDTSDDAMILSESSFVKSDGTKFNPEITEPLNIVVLCDKPENGNWEGSFSQ